MTELYYFDLNPEDKCFYLSKPPNQMTSCRECFIPVHSDNVTDLFLLIRIQKVFKGDIEKDIQASMKGKVIDFSITVPYHKLLLK